MIRKCLPALAAAALVLPLALYADEGETPRSGSSRLDPPEGGPQPEARGEVVINPVLLIVKVTGLTAGDYTVQIDDGTGTLADIGVITVRADDDDEEEDGEDGEEPAPTTGGGILKLRGDELPNGASSPADLAGLAINIVDASSAIVLQGMTPSPIAGKPEPQSGKCELARPDPPVDEDAAGFLTLESGEGRVVIKVHLRKLDGREVYDLVITNLEGMSESAGMATTNPAGNANFKIDSAKGDPIPFGATDLAALLGFGISVRDAEGDVVLVGQVCETKPIDDDEEDDEEEEEEEEEEEGDGGDAGDGGGAGHQVETRFSMEGEFDTYFLRGDPNADGRCDVSDAVFGLLYLFKGGLRPMCLDAADVNDDGAVDISDSAAILNHLFSNGKAPSYPGSLISGSDPTADGLFCVEP
jgi:hypothetical protein